MYRKCLYWQGLMQLSKLLLLNTGAKHCINNGCLHGIDQKRVDKIWQFYQLNAISLSALQFYSHLFFIFVVLSDWNLQYLNFVSNIHKIPVVQDMVPQKGDTYLLFVLFTLKMYQSQKWPKIASTTDSHYYWYQTKIISKIVK